MNLAYVMAGGALGSALRYGFSLWLKVDEGGFPRATFAVNIIGCVVFGFIAGWLTQGQVNKEGLRLALLVGVMGGFTTFSSFGFETIRLWEFGHQGVAVSYVLLSTVLGILGAYAAYKGALTIFN